MSDEFDGLEGEVEIQDDVDGGEGEMEFADGAPDDGAAPYDGDEGGGQAEQAFGRQDFDALNQSVQEIRQYQNEIRESLKAGQRPPAPETKQEAQAQAQAQADLLAEWRDHTKYNGFWKDVHTRPDVFHGGVARIAGETFAPHLQKFNELGETVKKQQEALNELMGFARLSNARFRENPEFAKYGQTAIELVTSGKVKDLDTAFELARLRSGGAVKPRPQVPAATGGRVPAGGSAMGGRRFAPAAGRAVAQGRVPPKTPPRQEPSLKGRGRTGMAGSNRLSWDSSKKDGMATAALEAADRLLSRGR
jgi:hypothetical protein